MSRERTRHPLSRSWTPEEDAVLLKMLHQGRLLGSISVRLKRSIKAVYARKGMLERGAVSTEPKRSTASPQLGLTFRCVRAGFQKQRTERNR